MLAKIKETADFIKSKINATPEFAIILGSGLGKLKDELKSKIIFSTHNLVTDNSFNEFQLILCRNVLIYFDRPLQNKVFELFNNSLEKFGYIALGTKETLDFSSVAKNFERLKGEKIWRKIHE